VCKFGGNPAICLREEAICAKVYRQTDGQTTDAALLLVTRRATLADRAFLVVAARAWNGLPDYVTSASTYASFRTALKTYLFSRTF